MNVLKKQFTEFSSVKVTKFIKFLWKRLKTFALESGFKILKRIVTSYALVLVILLLWKKLTLKREPRWVREAPEVVPPTLTSRITGSVLHFVTKGTMCRTFMGKDIPDILRFSNGLAAGFIRDFILIKDPQLVKAVLNEKETAKPEKGYRGFKRLTGYKGSVDFLSVRTHGHPLYSTNRAKVYKALMKRTTECFDSVFIPTVEELCNRLENSSHDVRVVDEMHHIATSLITRVAFDEHSDQFDRSLFESAIWIINDTLLRPQNNNFKILDNLPTPWNTELKRRQQMLVETIESMIHRKKQQRRQGRKSNDVINVLMDNEINQDEDLLGILSIFFFAGFDTTSNTMTLILHHLAENPDVQEQCREEIDDIIGLDEKPTLQKLQRLRYLKAVISETLRLYPTVPMIAREVTEDHGKICPRFNEKDAFGVAINLFGVHYNEDGWNDPESFIPERWLNPDFDKDMDESKRLYCPFALGKRACLGKQFATVEMLTVISMIVQRFEIKKSFLGSELDIKEAGSLIVNHDFHLKFVACDDPMMLSDISFTEKVYTHLEVAEHNHIESAWIIINGVVYDITDYLAREDDDHPGGIDVLLNFAGTDASEDFEHQGHSEDAYELLKEFRIGIVEPLKPEPLPMVFRRSSSTVASTRSSLPTRPRSSSVSVRHVEMVPPTQRKRRASMY